MTKTRTTALDAVAFEPDFVAALTDMFENKIVFNSVLGLKITSLAPTGVAGRIQMKHDLVGHFSYNRLHGGVISSGLDAIAGLAVMAAARPCGARRSTCASTIFAPRSASIST